MSANFSAAAKKATTPHTGHERVSLAEYERLIEADAFGRRDRIELIRGEIREMNPIGSRHEAIVDRLNEWSIENRPRAEVIVRVQNSIWLPSAESAPQPDLAWVARRDYYDRRATLDRGRRKHIGLRHGREGRLICEVGHSGLLGREFVDARD